MSELVLESLHWNWDWISTRSVTSPKSSGKIFGHHGEWFSTAVGAYLALRHRQTEQAAVLAGEILGEIEREAEIFNALVAAGQGIETLKAATLIAHNIGDLKRVFEMWEITEDPLESRVKKRLEAFPFPEVANLNNRWMAIENHRHFALRKPRSLRRYVDLLLPVGPFFDEWGVRVASDPRLSLEDLGSILEALVDGYHRLPGPVGYARALRGIEEVVPGGFDQLLKYVPRRAAGALRTGELRQLMSVDPERFRLCWESRGLVKNQSRNTL